MKKWRDINTPVEKRRNGRVVAKVWKRGSEESAGSGAMEGRKKHVDTETQPERNKQRGFHSTFHDVSYLVFNLNLLPDFPCCSSSLTPSLHAPLLLPFGLVMII
ncbi:hypothetical protein DEO72_LG1g3118 [Vigna unguiculata]|uniref:Uncharacterized protein n=1 Tax=Vigna unguiculata TaxID=3917 RepID=A0A4D6KN13_VIGUN|nr:hypothetical protein DEO72_LG1g3118 [Vigna unguiculata]